jgi:hypothetical protein
VLACNNGYSKPADDLCRCRCFDEVHHCELWERLEELLRRKYPSAVLAALQLYSDKTLLNFKGITHAFISTVA